MARTPPLSYLHLIAWSQIGVLVRVYFAEIFGSACPSIAWAPCLASSGSRYGGAFFADLPSNIFGSFLMGLFVSSDVLSNSLKHVLSVEAPMAMLPIKSPLQDHLAFQVGLRTGLCGSLTTFASWLTQMTLMIVGGTHTTVLHHTQWLEALGGLAVGTLAALSALVVGQHCALLLYHKLNPGAFIPYGSPAPEQNKLEGLDQGLDEQAGEGLAGAEWGEEPEELARQQLRTVSSITRGTMTVVVVDGGHEQQQQQQQWGAGQRLHSLSSFSQQQQQQCHTGQRLHSLTSFSQQQQLQHKHKHKQQQQQHQQPQQLNGTGAQLSEQQPRTSSSSEQSQQELQLAQTGTTAAAAADALLPQPEQQQGKAAAATPGTLNAAAVVQANSAPGGLIGRSADNVVPVSKEAPHVEEEVIEEEEEAPSRSWQHKVVDGFAALSIVVLSGVSLWRIVQSSTSHLPHADVPFAHQWYWWSILLGPLGCWLRYYLSRFNGKLPGDWKWFPIGTFAANITACVIDYVMKVVPVWHPLDTVSTAVLAGVVGGVGGCLSTVSTWVVEIQRLMLSFPLTSHGYQYTFISLGTALSLGLLIYGIPLWTMH